MIVETKELLIKEPMVVAKNGMVALVTSREVATAKPIDILADAQLYEAESDTFTPILPLGSFDKFLDGLEVVDPPEPFVRQSE